MDDEGVKVEEEVKKIIISAPSDEARAEGTVRRNSTGKANTRTSLSPFSSDEKHLPNYLRASTSSCHEFCKHGKKHVFEPKKRQPKHHRVTGNRKAHEEEEETEISVVQGRRKKVELKVKTADQPKGGLLNEPKGNKQNFLEIIQLPATNAIIENKEAFGSPESLDLEHSPCTASEESLEGPVSIDTSTLSAIHQIEELSYYPETTQLESSSSSPTEKRVISQEPTTPLILSEGFSDGSEIMELEPLTLMDTPNPIEGSFEENFGVEVMTQLAGTKSMSYIDEPVTSNPTIPSMQKSKAKIPQSTVRSIASRAQSSAREEKSSVKQITRKNLKIVEGKMMEDTKMKTLPQLKTVSNRTKAVETKRTELTGQPTVTKKKPPSLVEKTIVTSDKPFSSEQKTPSSVEKAIMSVSPRITKQKASPAIQSIATRSQPSISSKPRTHVLKSTPTPTSGRMSSIQRKTGNKIMKSAEDPTPKSSRALVSTRPSAGREIARLNSVKLRSLKTSSPLKIQAKLGKLDETVKEKTLYVIEPKTRKKDQKHVKKGLKKNKGESTSSYSSSSEVSYGKEENEENESTLGEDSEVVLNKERTKRSTEKTKPSRTATPRSEARIPSPHKLNFQRGKVVNPKPEANAPRRLKFRQSNSTGESQTGKERRVIRRRVSCGSAAELINPKVEAPAVVLRHQDVQEKKETQGLFNLVIEETASKLVEAKKSKVKALVGAFETVISLQESRVRQTV